MHQSSLFTSLHFPVICKKTRYCPIRGQTICSLPMAVRWPAAYMPHVTGQ